MKKIICYIFGHNEEDFTDSGYMICKRCKCHEYYDGWGIGIFAFIWQRIKRKIGRIKDEIYYRIFNELPF